MPSESLAQHRVVVPLGSAEKTGTLVLYQTTFPGAVNLFQVTP